MSRLRAMLRAHRAPIVLTPAYANTGLSDLSGALYQGLDIVSRELIGIIPTVQRNATVERAAVGQTVTYPIVPTASTTDVVPSMTVPTPADWDVDNGTLTITKSKAARFAITGEEELRLSHGVGYRSIQADQFAQALRALTNEIEADLMAEAAANASLVYNSGSALFSGDKMTDAAQIRKLLDDNGAPRTGRAMTLNTTAGAAMRSMTNLTNVDNAGTTMTLRDGELLNLMGFSIHESGQPVSHTKGTGASATTDDAGYAVGTKTITLASAGTGTIVAGDTITFAGDITKYVVASGDTDVSNGGTITLTTGLRQAIPASATNITVADSYDVEAIAYSQDALVLAARAPALPSGGDLAVDRMLLVDPRSGLSFEVSMYAGYKMMAYEVAASWGVKAVKSDHIVLGTA